MDRWKNMGIFARVARLGSFSKASEELRISTTATSRRVSELEDHLGVRLLHRTTRKLRLTEEGERYLERCEQLLRSVEQLEDDIKADQAGLQGTLSVTAGTSFTQELLGSLFFSFCQMYPKLSLRLHLSDAHLDLLEHGLDAAIRVGFPRDSALVGRKLTLCRHVLCGSPAYLDAHGTPEEIDDLDAHRCVIDTNNEHLWRFSRDGQEFGYQPTAQLYVNHAHIVRDALLAGMGIGLCPTFMIGEDIEAGRLVPVLLSYGMYDPPLYLVYPPARHLPAKTEALRDFLLSRLSQEPPWDRWRQSWGLTP